MITQIDFCKGFFLSISDSNTSQNIEIVAARQLNKKSQGLGNTVPLECKSLDTTQ